MTSDPKQTTDTDRKDLDPEPLAIDADDINDFIDRNERTERDPGERDIDTQVQPPQ
jgi:hypothetical protein